jgi:hypothetical protein
VIQRLKHAVVWGVLLIGRARGEVEEYQLKAAVVFNFAKFVEWPPQSFGGSGDPITLCVLGQNPFGHWLGDTLAGKVVNGKAFTIRKISGSQEAGRCQIVFVSSSERKRCRAVLDGLRAEGLLTVGDTPGFADMGGVVNLRLEEETVRMEVNVEAARQKNLQISAKLLSLARIVK